MELVVISPPGAREGEQRVVADLFRHGLRRYHLRKPGWGREQVAGWLEALEPNWRARVVLHAPHDFASRYGLGGVHGGRVGTTRATPREDVSSTVYTSQPAHSAEDVRRWAGKANAVLLSPVFESASKPGRELLPESEIAAALAAARGGSPTLMYALSGVTAARVPELRRRGFDGVAVLGAIWDAADPLAAFAELQRACRAEPVMCLTQDGLHVTHEQQVHALCAAGAKWIQLRMKSASDEELLTTVRRAVPLCRVAGAVLIVNDRVDVALAAGADGAHLGAHDGDWRSARAKTGPGFILGGTVNNAGDARRAGATGVFDYVGVGPVRWTATKQRLAPVLGIDGIRAVVGELAGLPAWAIGGVTPADAPALHAAGVAGVAVTGYLHRGNVADNFRRLSAAWWAASEATAAIAIP